MARGRMIENSICSNKKFNKLSDDTSRLAYALARTFADRDGRIIGDAEWLASAIFPYRRDMELSDIETYVTEWVNVGLVVWYQIDDTRYIEFIDFAESQKGLRYDREAASTIPPSSNKDAKLLARSDAGVKPEPCRSDAGVSPAEVNRSEKKRSEVNTPDSPPLSQVIHAYIKKLRPGSAPTNAQKQLVHKWEHVEADQIPNFDEFKAAAAIVEWSETKWSAWREKNGRTYPDLSYFKGVIADYINAPKKEAQPTKCPPDYKPYTMKVDGVPKTWFVPLSQFDSVTRIGTPSVRMDMLNRISLKPAEVTH